MNPNIAIGIHVQTDPERLRATLDALHAYSDRSLDVWLLLDGPDKPMRAALARLESFHQSATESPAGLPACFNRLARSTEADVIVLLESGALVGPGWLERLMAALGADPRNGLAGPSTNLAWNAQAVFRQTPDTVAGVAAAAHEAHRRFGTTWRTLEPLYSLSDFCYAVRRHVIESIGPADEGYGLGPCWEMDYNIRAARAGWRGVWVCGAYVHRSPSTERRQRDEARMFEASKRRYQDKFCGARLRGEKTDYRLHCRGDACPNFAPGHLLRVAPASRLPPTTSSPATPPPAEIDGQPSGWPLVSCIMPTCDRLQFIPQAISCFLRQDYPNLELVIIDDGKESVAPLLPNDNRVRLIRPNAKKNVGAKRNAACAAAKGEIIVHWDDDDWYPPDRVTRQVEALGQPARLICGTSVLYYYEPITGRAWRYRYGGGRAWVAGNTLAYRKSWWVSHPFPEIQVGEDSRFVWSAPAKSICDLNWPGLCAARIHPGNTSRKPASGTSWEPRPVQELQSVLGPDWASFAALGATALPTTEPPMVSCIMPTFNRRSFLPLALQGFLAQSYPRKELVIVDDGTDNVSDLLGGLASVRYLRLQERARIGCKRNLACEAAQGSIIAHWDDDDWYGPDRLQHQVGPLVSSQADLTGLEDSFELELSQGEFWQTTRALHQRMFFADMHGGTLVYWKSLFDEGARYPESNLAEDAAFLRQVLRRGKRVLRLNNPGLFVYMRHHSNAWRFQAGQFLDANGWHKVTGPPSFPPPLLSAYQLAAVEQAAASALGLAPGGRRVGNEALHRSRLNHPMAMA